MKKVMLWAVILIASMNSVNAWEMINESNWGESKCHTHWKEVENYVSYKNKIDNLFFQITKKPENIQHNYYTKIDKISTDLLKKTSQNKQQMLYTVIWYLSCVNNNEMKKAIAYKELKKKFSNVDRETFSVFEWHISSKKNMYTDEKYMYSFPINDEWRRLSMNTKKIERIQKSSYYFDWSNVYFMWFSGVMLVVENVSLGMDNVWLFSNSWLITLDDTLYFNWKSQAHLKIDALNNITVDKTWIYFTVEERLFFFNFDELTEIKDVDANSFVHVSKNRFYEDMKNTYELKYGHYGFEIIKKEK